MLREVLRLSILFLLITPFSFTAKGENLKIAFLPSWGESWDDPRLVYSGLAENWEEYGRFEPDFYPVDQPITEAALVQIEPDIILISNPSGGNHTYTEQEKNVIADYLSSSSAGLLGTFKFNHSFYLYDNSFLMELFGVDGSFLTVWDVCTSGFYDLLIPEHPLFYSCDDPFRTRGFPCSQEIDAESWHEVICEPAFIAAESPDGAAVMIIKDEPYRSFYCSSMPDYCDETPGDNRLMYNALVWLGGHDPRPPIPSVSCYGILILVMLATLEIGRNELKRKNNQRISRR